MVMVSPPDRSILVPVEKAWWSRAFDIGFLRLSKIGLRPLGHPLWRPLRPNGCCHCPQHLHMWVIRPSSLSLPPPWWILPQTLGCGSGHRWWQELQWRAAAVRQTAMVGRPGHVWRLNIDWCDDAYEVSEWWLLCYLGFLSGGLCQTHTSCVNSHTSVLNSHICVKTHTFDVCIFTQDVWEHKMWDQTLV